MERVTTIGLDIAKSTFQVHGLDASGEVILTATFDAGTRGAVFREGGTLLGWNRGLCDIASLGARVAVSVDITLKEWGGKNVK